MTDDRLARVLGTCEEALGREGAELFDGHTGTQTRLKASKIRGVESAGMVLSERELGLSDEHEGILDAVERGDAPAARDLMLRHVRRSGRLVTLRFEQRGTTADDAH